MSLLLSSKYFSFILPFPSFSNIWRHLCNCPGFSIILQLPRFFCDFSLLVSNHHFLQFTLLLKSLKFHIFCDLKSFNFYILKPKFVSFSLSIPPYLATQIPVPFGFMMLHSSSLFPWLSSIHSFGWGNYAFFFILSPFPSNVAFDFSTWCRLIPAFSVLGDLSVSIGRSVTLLSTQQGLLFILFYVIYFHIFKPKFLLFSVSILPPSQPKLFIFQSFF